MAEFCAKCFVDKIEPNARMSNIELSETKDWCEGCGAYDCVVLGIKNPNEELAILDGFFEIPRYRGRLLINKKGQVYSLLSHKILKPHKMPNGYVAYCIMYQHPRRHTKTEYLHRFLAETFIPNPQNKATVNHIDGNKENNSLENLEWATQSENNMHALRNNIRNPNTVGLEKYNNSKRVLSDADVLFIKGHKDMSVSELCAALKNTHKYAIYDCKVGRSFKNICS